MASYEGYPFHEKQEHTVCNTDQLLVKRRRRKKLVKEKDISEFKRRKKG
jgi:hypothetical protein